MSAASDASRMTPLWINALAAWFLCGLIWFVQVVHYPLFGAVGDEVFAAYEVEHAARTTRVVAAPMLLEAAAALLLWLRPPAGVPRAEAAAGALLVGIIWGSTFLLQVPRHDELSRGYDPAAHQALVATNWIRTVAWTLRAASAARMLSGALSGAPRRIA